MSITMIMDLYSESLQVGWIQTKSSKFSIHYGVLFASMTFMNWYMHKRMHTNLQSCCCFLTFDIIPYSYELAQWCREVCVGSR